MQKTLGNATDYDQISKRIAALTMDARRKWGKMSVGGMLCHLHDSYQLPLGGRLVTPMPLPLPRGAIKYLALRTPLPWAKGLKTLPEVAQEIGGTRPGLFGDDQARLLATLACFCESAALHQATHPFFGPMSIEDWLRWGYLHADHHLRQFSA